MRYIFEEEFRIDHPDTVGSAGSRFDLDNYKDWLEAQLIEARKQLALYNVNVLAAGWISVNDRLPENNCDVIVVKRNGKVYQMSYHAPFGSSNRLFHWWGFGNWVDQHSQVTHWMPLPSPPDR